MSEFESAFLCGILDRFLPKKIVEVGIAGGATTAIVTECLVEQERFFEMHSVDILESFYLDKSKKSGFLGMEADTILSVNHSYKHFYHLGNVSCAFYKEIGDSIDCLILDTAHIAPGEIIDFITMLPYLKDGCVVILHDIILSHITPVREKNKWATAALLSAVKGAKYINFDSTKKHKIPNIGAFVVDETTRECIADVFLALLIPWSYIPNNESLTQYRKCIQREYDDEYLTLFDAAVGMNSKTISPKATIWKFPFFSIPDKCKIILYGAGNVGRAYYDQVKGKKDIELIKWIDQMNEKYRDLGVEPVESIQNLKYDIVVVAAANKDVADDMISTLMRYGCPRDKVIWYDSKKEL